MLNARERFWAAAAWPISSIWHHRRLAACALLSQCGLCRRLGCIGGGCGCNCSSSSGPARARACASASWLAALGRRRIKDFFKALGAGTIGSASVQIGAFVDTLICQLPACRRADRHHLCRQHQPVAAGHPRHRAGRRCCCRKCRHGWQRAMSRVRKARRTTPRRWPCSSRCPSWPPSCWCRRPSCAASSRMALSLARPPMSAATALTAYGVGLPAFVLVRVLAATFYARHDTATPVRATLLAVAVQYRHEVRAGLGHAPGGGWRGAGDLAGHLGQCQRADLAGTPPRSAPHRFPLSAGTACDLAGGVAHRRRGAGCGVAGRAGTAWQRMCAGCRCDRGAALAMARRRCSFAAACRWDVMAQ